VLDRGDLAEPNDALGQAARHPRVSIQPGEPLELWPTAWASQATAQNTQMGLGVEDRQIAHPALADVVDRLDCFPAALADHATAGHRFELDPRLRPWPLHPGLEALDVCDLVPLPNAEPLDKLEVGHGSLRLLVASNSKLPEGLPMPLPLPRIPG